MKNPYTYQRRESLPLRVGGRVTIGGGAPVVVQSMCTTDTADVEASAAQVMEIARAGAEMVRLTAPGMREAERLLTIRRRIEEQECYVPLVADIHFNPAAAAIAAQYVGKVRINPGNFVDRRTAEGQQVREYTDAEWAEELERLRREFTELLHICKHYGTALRIGVNHGSLSERIMSRWGDTTEGMVQSALEFLRVCRDEEFDRVVVSMKSSNARVMVEAYRLLVLRLEEEELPPYPLHLGVTEAGEGEDGRIRSAVGIGSLLADGIGDTIRVSLTEPPQNEIVPARLLARYFEGRELHNYIPFDCTPSWDPYRYHRRESAATECQGIRIGGAAVPVVVGGGNPGDTQVSQGSGISGALGADIGINTVRLLTPFEALAGAEGWIACTLDHLTDRFTAWLARPENQSRVLLLASENSHWVGEIRACFARLGQQGARNPVILSRCYHETSLDALQLYAAADFGALFIDGLGDGLWIVNEVSETRYDEDAEGRLKTTVHNVTPPFDLDTLSLAILQASRARFSHTEIISCPGCGRTLFDLQGAARAVKERFGGRPEYAGLKIAVMGCIVNGPGEMADADYGYVGAGGGRVTLYKGSQVLARAIPESEALAALEKEIESHRPEQ